MNELLHGTAELLEGAKQVGAQLIRTAVQVGIPGSIESEEKWDLLRGCNRWVADRQLPEGQFEYELVNLETGQPIVVLDLAWPHGLQPGLSKPVAVLLDEGPETLAAANNAGFRYFTSIEAFQTYVETEILASEKITERW